MSTEPGAALPEELLAHAAWVRSLAAALVRDPGAADDLAQETWLAALESPPEDDRPLRPWLAGVLRNLWKERLRGEGRRARREERAAEGREPLPSPEDLAARLETQRLLAGFVAALEEPFRSTVLLRFYEGLSSAEIARRTGAPEGTVRWRLKRALDDLRVRLDAGHAGDRGKWTAAFAPLVGGGGGPPTGIPKAAGPGPGAATATAAGGMAIMGAVTKAVVGAVLLAAGVSAWLLVRDPGVRDGDGRGRPVAGLPEAPVRRPGAAPTPGPAGAPTPGPGTGAPEAGKAPPGGKPLAAPSRAFLLGRAILPGGAPCPGAKASVPRSAVSVDAGPDGRFRLEVPAGVQNLVVHLQVSAPARAVAVAVAAVSPGKETAVGDLVLDPGGTVSGRVVDAGGLPVSGAWVGIEQEGIASVPQEERSRWQAGGLVAEPETVADAAGEFRLEGVPVGVRSFWAGKEGFRSGTGPAVEVREGAETAGTRLVLEPMAPEDTVEGLVTGPDGKPAPGAVVQWNCSEAGRMNSTSTQADDLGRFVLRLPFAGTVSIMAHRRGDREGASAVLAVQPGARGVLLHIAEPRVVTLRVLDGDGAPVTRFGFTFMHPDMPNFTEPCPEEDRPLGTASLALPCVRFRLLVHGTGFLEKDLGPFDPAEAPSTWEAVLESAGSVRGRVVSGGIGVAGATVTAYPAVAAGLRLEVNGFVCRMEAPAAAPATTGPDGSFTMSPREAGSYILLAEAKGLATGEAGPFDLDPARGRDGLEIRVGQGGAIEGRVIAAPGRSPEGVVVAVSRGDGHPRSLRAGPEGRYRFEGLTPGPWLVTDLEKDLDPTRSRTWIGPGSSSIPWSCRVEEGATTRFDLDLSRRGTAVLRGAFRLGDGSMDGWAAGLVDAGNVFVQVKAAVPLSPEGAFTLPAREAGQCRVELQSSAPQMFVLAPVDVRAGGSDWSLSLPAGSLEGTAPAGTTLAVVVPLADDVFALAVAIAGPDGAFRVSPIPAGTARIVRMGKELASEPDPRRWPAAAEVAIPAGGAATATVR